jgi:hypothetical protein
LFANTGFVKDINKGTGSAGKDLISDKRIAHANAFNAENLPGWTQL